MHGLQDLVVYKITLCGLGYVFLCQIYGVLCCYVRTVSRNICCS